MSAKVEICRHTQSGFFLPALGMTGYIAAGAAAVIGVLLLTVWAYSSRLEHCNESRIRDNARYETILSEYDLKLKAQNALVEKLGIETKARQEAVRVALEAAGKQGKALATESARLKAQLGKSKPGECGAAVQQVRAGLK